MSARKGTLLNGVCPGDVPVLARYLSGPALREIHRTGRSPYVAAAFRAAGLPEVARGASMLDAARLIFAQLRRSYRSDYVYRAAIANKIFLGRHSPTTTTLLPELRVWRCKADMVMLNGTSVAYEIKSDLDNLDRLAAQLDTYARVFDRIHVVTSERMSTTVRHNVPDFVGLIILTKAFTLRTVREATSNADRVDIDAVADALRLGELKELTQRLCGSIPDATAVRMFDECRARLANCLPRRVHDATVSILKKRRVLSRSDFGDLPMELVAAYMESGLPPRDWHVLNDRLTKLTIGDFVDAHP